MDKTHAKIFLKILATGHGVGRLDEEPNFIKVNIYSTANCILVAYK